MEHCRKMLRTGGRLVVDGLSQGWHTENCPRKASWRPTVAPEIEVMDEIVQQSDKGMLTIRRSIKLPTYSRTFELRQHLYTPERLRRLLAKTGFQEVQMWGDWMLRPLDRACHIVAVARA